MKKFPVGLQLYSVRDDMEKDFEGTVAKVAAMGYDGVEFAGTFGKTAREVKTVCEKYGVTPVSAHVPFADMQKDPEGVAKYYSEVGVTQVVIPWLGEEFRPGTDGYGEFRRVVRETAAALKKYGLVLCYHNHDFEFVTLNNEYLLDIMYRDFDETLLQSQIDVCWAHVGMGDPASYLRKFAGRAPTVHFKDYAGEKNDHMYELIGKDEDAPREEPKQKFEFRPVGYGKQDFVELLKASEDVGAKWVIVEQDNPSLGKTPLECAKMSVQYIKALF